MAISIIKDHSDSKRENLLPPLHGLFFLIQGYDSVSVGFWSQLFGGGSEFNLKRNLTTWFKLRLGLEILVLLIQYPTYRFIHFVVMDILNTSNSCNMKSLYCMFKKFPQFYLS